MGRQVRVLGYVGTVLVAVGISVLVLRRLKFGDIDPLSAGIGIVSALLACAGFVVAVRAGRWQEGDISVLTDKLAKAVLATEQQARGQLLGKEGRAIDVAFLFQPTPARNADGAAREGRLVEVVDYYQKLRPARMVITGPAGAGKTVLAIELIMMLLENRVPGDPVPVRLPASSWNLSGDLPQQVGAGTRLMQRWLVDYLRDVYQFPSRWAQELVQAGRVLPVVDGLDELDATQAPGYASRAGQALQVFNAYQRYRDKAAMIVTCRSEQYDNLIAELNWVEDAARVEIAPVSVAQARAFITARTVDASRWQTVLENVQRARRGPLAMALATPWRLTLAVSVYEQRTAAKVFVRDPLELTSPELDSPEAVRDHLLSLFLPAVLGKIPNQPYGVERVHRWLAVLAAYLDRNAVTGRNLGGRPLSGTDLVLHELWPLAGFRRPREVNRALMLLLWLILLPPLLVGLLADFTATAAVLAFLPFVAIQRSWSEFWPLPQRLNLDKLRTPQGRRRVMYGLAYGLAVGLGFGLGSGVTAGFAFGIMFGFTAALMLGLAESVAVATLDPRSIVRNDLAVWIVSGLTVGCAAGLVAGPVVGMAVGLGFGLTAGLAGGPAGGRAGFRYVALLLCTRRWGAHWLPWRLGRFLNICYQAGLVRIAGASYQFRHRELQEYLARHPQP